jgi:hypothetical protein
MFTFNINYPAGFATIVSFLSLVCHTGKEQHEKKKEE